MTPEGKVKVFIKKYMNDNFPDAWKYMPPGGYFGKSGTPDHLYYWHGVFVALEAKAPGEKATPLQLKQLNLLKDNGAIVAVISGKDKERMDIVKRLMYLEANINHD